MIVGHVSLRIAATFDVCGIGGLFRMLGA